MEATVPSELPTGIFVSYDTIELICGSPRNLFLHSIGGLKPEYSFASGAVQFLQRSMARHTICWSITCGRQQFVQQSYHLLEPVRTACTRSPPPYATYSTLTIVAPAGSARSQRRVEAEAAVEAEAGVETEADAEAEVLV